MRRFWKNQRGVTMIEVLVTIAILAIVVVPCLSAFVMAQRGNVKAAETTNAYTAAANLMEELKGTEWDKIDDRFVTEIQYNDVYVIYGSDELVTAFCTPQMKNEISYYYMEIFGGKLESKPSGVEPILKGVIAP